MKGMFQDFNMHWLANTPQKKQMGKYVALAPKKTGALNVTSWCHMCRSLKTLMPCSAPSTWKRCFRNCVIPCVSNIPWSEIFSGSVSESKNDILSDTVCEMQKRPAASFLLLSDLHQLPGALMVIMMASLSPRCGDGNTYRKDPWLEKKAHHLCNIGSTFEVLTVSEFQQALEKFGFQLSPEDTPDTR